MPRKEILVETIDLPVNATYDGREPELIYKPVQIKAVEELIIKLKDSISKSKYEKKS